MKNYLSIIALFFSIIIITISCKKTVDVTPEVFCYPILQGSDSSPVKFIFDASGKAMSAEIDGTPVSFEYSGSNITKMKYLDASANRSVTVEYDTQNRPSKAKKTYTSTDLNYTADFVVVYDANGRVSTENVSFKGDFEIVMTHRLEYDAKGNVLKQYVKENNNPEYLFTENSGFDDKKNPGRAIKLNPLILFYEPLNLFDNQSENNQTVVKTRVKNSEYLGSVYNIDIKYVFTDFNTNSYPTAGTQDFTIEHDDFNDPNSTKTVTEKGSTKVKFDYLCK
jgi:hypothetical protein